MAFPGNSTTRVRFGEFEIDLRTGEVLTNGRKTLLSEKPLQLLAALLEIPGEMVTREELKQRLWSSDTFVDFDLSLNKTVNRLREALGDSADQPRFVETFPKRGYRFIGPVDWNGRQSQELIATAIVAPSSRQKTGRILLFKRLVGILLALSAALVIAIVILKPGQYPSFPKIRQLTTNSSELPIRTAAISPDGKRLAFSDIKGLHIKDIETGENRDIPFPQTTASGRVDWQIMAWFPDGEGFLANIAPFEDVCLHCEHFSAWAVPANGGVPQRLREDANAESVSPDGSRIAFTADLGMPGGHEIWLTDSKGNSPTKVYKTNANDWVRYVKWSPDGKRLAYIRSDDQQEILESRELGSATPILILSASEAHGIHDYVWTPDGRIVYGTDAGSSYAHDCNYWEIRVNSETGKPTSTPKRVTNWAGFVMEWTSISSDAKHLAFVESVDRSAINLLALGPSGIRRDSARKLTLSESWNLPLGWTPDSRTLVFASSRDGIWGIYKQNVNDDSPSSLSVRLPDSPLAGAVTPDGKWVVYLQRRAGSNPQTMRLALSGGRPEPLDMQEEVLGIGCSRVQLPRCVVIGPGTDRGELVFFSFSPMNGHTDELVRFNLPTNREDWEWQLSPDGRQVALLVPSEGRIHLIALESHQRTEIPLNNFSSAYHLAWAADGKSLLLSNATRQGAALIRIDLRGITQTLLEQRGDLSVLALPSPDGRFLAVTKWTIASNVWMLENF